MLSPAELASDDKDILRKRAASRVMLSARCSRRVWCNLNSWVAMIAPQVLLYTLTYVREVSDEALGRPRFLMDTAAV